MSTIKTTAIVPNYNSSEFLAKSLQSLVNQTEPFTEIIVVDDGSTDQSLTLIDDFMKKYPLISLIKHETNQGVCAALNTGIAHATGDYIILCAADDWYHQDIVKYANQTSRQFPSVGLICGDAIVNRFDMRSTFRRMLSYKKNRLISPDEFKKIARRQYVGFNGGGGMFMHRESVLKAGLLYPQLRWHCDWLLYFVVALEQGIFYIDSVFVYINMRKEGYSEGKKNWKVQKQVIKDTLLLLEDRYSHLWNDFKKAALLPHYSIRYVPLFLKYPYARRFFSLSLMWKFIINNNIVIRIGRLFPYRIILGLRKLLRS